MTKKIVPDPPPITRAFGTDNTAFSARLLDRLTFTRFRPVAPESLDKPSLFAIQQGVSAYDALAHVSRLLETAELNGDELSLRTDPFERALFWSMLHSVEMARAVVDALLDGVPVANQMSPEN